MLQVLDLAPVEADSTVNCLTNLNGTPSGAPQVQSFQYKSMVTVWRGSNRADSDSTSNSTVQYNSSFNSTWNATWNGTWNSSSATGAWQQFTEPYVCVSYKLDLCTGADCTDYENVPGVGTWAYYPLKLSECYQMQWLSHHGTSHFSGVVCCTTDDCNIPNLALDSRTQILGPIHAVVDQQQCRSGAYVTTPNVLGATVNWTVAIQEATPFSGTYVVFLKIAATIDPAWEEQQDDLNQRYTHWTQAVLPIQPALFEPPSSLHLPSPFTVRAFDGLCKVSSVPVACLATQLSSMCAYKIPPPVKHMWRSGAARLMETTQMRHEACLVLVGGAGTL